MLVSSVSRRSILPFVKASLSTASPAASVASVPSAWTFAAAAHGSSCACCGCSSSRGVGRRSQSTTASAAKFESLHGLKGRNLLSIADLSTEDLKGLLQLAQHFKNVYRGTSSTTTTPKPRPLLGDSMAMIFQKRSTRTRVSTETGMALLGGHALFLGPSDVQLGVNESMRDTACVLSRFNSLLLARVFGHDDVLELCRYATVPVINALSDLHHPLQTLADLLTLQQHYQHKVTGGGGGTSAASMSTSTFDALLQGKTLAWVGDGNNVLHDLMLGCTKMGMHVKIATPKGYEPNAGVLQTTQRLAHDHGVTVTTTHVASEAVQNANVVVTDTWVSMGQEDEYQKRVKEFEGYEVTMKLLEHAAPEPVFLHCLPRHKEEVSDEVFYHPDISLVFPEAENRMWTVMAVMAAQLGKFE